MLRIYKDFRIFAKEIRVGCTTLSGGLYLTLDKRLY